MRITGTECREIKESGNATKVNVSTNSGRPSNLILQINPSSSNESNDQPKTYNTPTIPNKIAAKSQREQLVSTPRASAGNIGDSSIPKDKPATANTADKSPQSTKEAIKNCFGFEDSSSQSDIDITLGEGIHVDTTCNSTIGISPVRRASILPQKGKLAGHFPGSHVFNSTSTSVTSPGQPKTHVISAEESRILSGNFLAPKLPNRYNAIRKKGEVPPCLPPPANFLPHHSYSLSPKTFPNSNRVPVERNANNTEQPSTANQTQTHKNVGKDGNIPDNGNCLTKYCVETKDNCPLSNLETVQEMGLVEDRRNDCGQSEDVPALREAVDLQEQHKGNGDLELADKNAFAVLKETTKNNVKANKKYKTKNRKISAAHKLPKSQTQPLVYETVGTKKQLKAITTINRSKVRYVHWKY